MENILIDVGTLQSTSSVFYSTNTGLVEFTEKWSKGHQPSITWDLRNLRVGKVNVAAASFLLAIAHRVRSFTGRKQDILIEWHPKQFTFLYDINFFDLADDYDLFDWPFDIGGYDSGIINPNTKILAYDKLIETPDLNNIQEISEWKQLHREEYRSNIINRCEALFALKDNHRKRSLPLIMSRTCAELVTNSLLWGDSTSFVGLQRTTSRIYISVSDIGKGFKYSLSNKGILKKLNSSVDIESDLVSIIIGCVINENDFGLKRAISTVIELGGNITLSSSKGEVHFGANMWERFIFDIQNCDMEIAINNMISDFFINGKLAIEDREAGYLRSFTSSIRGTRISFTIPLSKGNK